MDCSAETVIQPAEPVSTVQRIRVTEHVLPTVLSAGTSKDDRETRIGGGIQDLEELERRMLLQEVQEIRQRSRRSIMEPIKEETELAFRLVGASDGHLHLKKGSLPNTLPFLRVVEPIV